MKELEQAVLSVLLGEKKHLTAKQQKIDVHEPEKDELTAKDFEMLRAGKKAKNEEVEVIDELKKSTIKSYANKKQAELDNVPSMPFKKPGMTKAEHEKAAKGMMGALARLSGKKPTSEEVDLDEEQINEISKGLAARAYNKMADDNNDMKGRTGLAGDQSDRLRARMNKRWGEKAATKAINKADKANEEFSADEQLKLIEQVIEFLLDEGWDDMLKAAKARSAPQPSGGSGVKSGTRYGGSRQKDTDEEEPKTQRMKSGARHGIKRRAKTNESQEHSFNEYLTAAIAKHGTTAEAVQIANEAFNNNDTSLLSNDTEA